MEVTTNNFGEVSGLVSLDYQLYIMIYEVSFAPQGT